MYVTAKVQLGEVATQGRKQVSIEPTNPALDCLEVQDLLGATDGGGLARVKTPRYFDALKVDEVRKGLIG